MEDEKATTDKPKEVWGIPHVDLKKMAATSIVGLIIAVAIYKINTPAPVLKVLVLEPYRFKGVENEFAIIGFNVRNDGNLVAEDVECSMVLNGFKIDDVGVSPHGMNPVINKEGFQVDVKRLNPKQTFQVLAYCRHPEKLPELPTIRVSAKNVEGIPDERPDNPITAISHWIIVVTIALGTGAFVGFLFGMREGSNMYKPIIPGDSKYFTIVEQYEVTIKSLEESRQVYLKLAEKARTPEYIEAQEKVIRFAESLIEDERLMTRVQGRPQIEKKPDTHS